MIRAYQIKLERYKEILDTVQLHLLLSLEDKKNLKTIIAYVMTLLENLSKLYCCLDANV